MYINGSIDLNEFSSRLVSSNIITESIDMNKDMISEMADSEDLEKNLSFRWYKTYDQFLK